ncbi:hypothetical protein SAMN05192543_106213 [Paraburkholderia megapolitana]|uniref:Uncharacterized protein n=1 Tax=Paraburkholderia megapolitana TaxID=420953 RepID=A0A1I3Q5E2_9BURK|nr:hypothetical protein SAMN05192543_106213 [Paraburkholderia megapolitana]
MAMPRALDARTIAYRLRMHEALVPVGTVAYPTHCTLAKNCSGPLLFLSVSYSNPLNNRSLSRFTTL